MRNGYGPRFEPLISKPSLPDNDRLHAFELPVQCSLCESWERDSQTIYGDKSLV